MKRIFLTGASAGIGLAAAHALTARGHEVWGTSRDVARLPQLQRFHPVRLDLRNNSEIDEAFALSLREAGHFDVVINNAGSGHFGAAEFLSDADLADQFQIVFFAHVRLMQLALAEMRARDAGLIVNVTSLASRLPVPFMSAYNAAKAAMVSLTMSLQLEMPNAAIRIVDLQPADISTSFNDSVRTSPYPTNYESRIAKTWETVERNMKAAPKPELVAEHLVRLVDQPNPPPRVTVGDLFQSKAAPLIFRFLPQRIRIWGLKKYYGI